MILDLSQIEFQNDFFTFDLPDGSVIVFNRISEDLVASMNTRSVDLSKADIHRVNIQVTKYDDYGNITEVVSTSDVIGFSDIMYRITTEYTQYEGSTLTEENMKFCKLEYYE